MKIITLPFLSPLRKQLNNDDPHIQVVVGPRQVGKTTGVQLLLNEKDSKEYLYFSADSPVSHHSHWLSEKWTQAKSQTGVQWLVVDEIQKVENWSSTIKQLWDSQQNETHRLKLILLGSSSLSIQIGLNESLAGRYFLHRVYHWNFQESQKAYGLDFETYIKFGGYPGSYRYLDDSSKEPWLNYMKNSIIDAVIGGDILSVARVKSPALFKQCFQIITSYPAQEISYTKILGQLQDKGNTDLVKTYLEYFESAFLIRQIYKYSSNKILTRRSSPKILPLCPALSTIHWDAELSESEMGPIFEVIVGSTLIRLPGDVFYWREKNYEVDFIYKYKNKIWALEVKSGNNKQAKGLTKFKEIYPQAKTLIITPQNFQNLEELLNT